MGLSRDFYPYYFFNKSNFNDFLKEKWINEILTSCTLLDPQIQAKQKLSLC
jgi:hypothetical protein